MKRKIAWARLGTIIVLLVINSLALYPSARAEQPLKKILFVCTGNYYRSRFAEAYFNWQTKKLELPWQAISRGLRPEPGRLGMAPEARAQLAQRGAPDIRVAPEPQQLMVRDLLTSDYVIVLDQEEHQPMMARQFPGLLLPQLHYWHIRDYPFMQAPEACAAMVAKINALLGQFLSEHGKVALEGSKPVR